MPKDFVGSENGKRKEYWAVDPRDVVIEQRDNGRHFGISEEKIQKKMRSLRQYGQLEPIGVRRLPDDRIAVTYGYTRLLAILRLQQEEPDANWMINVILAKNLNELEAFKRNIEENMERDALNPIDYAYQIDKLMDPDRFDQTIEQVQEIYHDWSQAKIYQYQKLVRLPEKVQRLVASNKLAVSNAEKLLKLPTEDAMVEAVKHLLVNHKHEEAVPTPETNLPENGAEDTAGQPKRRGRKPNPNKQPKVKSTKRSDTKVLKENLAKAGIKFKRTMADLLRVLSERDDDVSKAIKAFAANENEETDLLDAIDAAAGSYA